jgi:hypothetical protein
MAVTPQYGSVSSQHVSPSQGAQHMSTSSSTLDMTSNVGFDPSFIDSSDSSIFNIDISNFKFVNRYGALEFGMLGQISSAALEATDMENMDRVGQDDRSHVSYDANSEFATSLPYPQDFSSFQNIPNAASRQNSMNSWTPANGSVNMAAAERQTNDLINTGETPKPQGYGQGYGGPLESPETSFMQQNQSQQPGFIPQGNVRTDQLPRDADAFPGGFNTGSARRRRRNPADVYTSVISPYPYTEGFHKLIAFLQKHFPPTKVSVIARSLAAIRPSLLACHKDLIREDLIFMEKCFQRTLHEYEGFLQYYGTPSLIIRRDGEIAAVSPEFSLISGWPENVLLGKSPNLNVNIGQHKSGAWTGSSSRGAATPRVPGTELNTSQPYPVFIAEVLDQDTVIRFFQDFAELAFGASGRSIQTRGHIHKYKTKMDPGWGSMDMKDQQDSITTSEGITKGGASNGDADATASTRKDGCVDCMFCWSVNKDPFDIPMIIVMNVSNCITFAVQANRSQFLPVI